MTNYFATRPRASQISAWASPQSRAIVSRTILESEWEKVKRKFATRRCRFHHSGAVTESHRQQSNSGKEGKTAWHDRFEYRREPNGSWTIERLAPYENSRWLTKTWRRILNKGVDAS